MSRWVDESVEARYLRQDLWLLPDTYHGECFALARVHLTPSIFDWRGIL